MKHLTELERVLFAGEAKITTNKNKHAASRTRWLTINCIDLMLTLLKRKTGELTSDALSSLILLTFKMQHRTFLIEISKASTIGIEGGVVVLDECLRDGVGIHFEKSENGSLEFSQYDLPCVNASPTARLLIF